MLIQWWKKTQRVLYQELRKLKEKGPSVTLGLDGCPVVSNRQPVLYLDELLGSYRRPVPTEVVNLLCEKRSAQACIVVPVYIRLPFLNTP